MTQRIGVDTYNWSPQRYIELVELTDNPLLQEYQKAEIDYIISKIQSPETKTFIDVGAGYGRVLGPLARIARRVIAVEINQDMISELRRRAERVGNVEVIEGNGDHLSELLKDREITNPVILSLQNTLGTWEGNYLNVLGEMKKVAQEKSGELILSLFCQEGLKSEGILMYTRIKELVGEPDLTRTDFKKGIFRSKTNYTSKWWTPSERSEIKALLGGNIVGEVENQSFWIIHIAYK